MTKKETAPDVHCAPTADRQGSDCGLNPEFVNQAIKGPPQPPGLCAVSRDVLRQIHRTLHEERLELERQLSARARDLKDYARLIAECARDTSDLEHRLDLSKCAAQEIVDALEWSFGPGAKP